jgi:hypothetical protein
MFNIWMIPSTRAMVDILAAINTRQFFGAVNIFLPL